MSMRAGAVHLPLLVFARLAGKSQDQINRDIKARRLLSLSLGNRGQRIPDWQLDPLRHKLVLSGADVVSGCGCMEALSRA